MTGHMNFKLWSITFWSIELKACSASISKIPSALSSLKTSCIPCILVLDPTTCPPHSCNNPDAWRTSFFNRIITAFPAILLRTLKILLQWVWGLVVYLMRSICMQWMTPETLNFFLSSKHSLLANSANILRSSDDAVPNECNVMLRFFFQPTASRPDDPDLPFVSIAALKTRDSSMSSYITGWTGHICPCNNTLWGGSLASGCFCCNIFKVLSFKGKICLTYSPSNV